MDGNQEDGCIVGVIRNMVNWDHGTITSRSKAVTGEGACDANRDRQPLELNEK